MRCPSCGTLVREGASVCPACHATLLASTTVVPDDTRWCVSCGSAIPEDADTCPVCGMPAGGTFEEDGVQDERRPQGNATELVSAVPPAPEDGDNEAELVQDAPRRARMIVIAVLAALVVVGGTTLYITRPWDPKAYSTHATEDADTSMEGFPGEVSHLNAQDRAEQAEQDAYMKKATKLMDSLVVRMGQMSEEADTLYADLTSYLDTQDSSQVAASAATSTSLLKELRETMDELKSYELEDEDLATRQESLLVVASYLEGELDVLANSWAAANGSGASDGSQNDAYAAFQWGSGGRSYDEWHTLFTNSYGGVKD